MPNAHVIGATSIPEGDQQISGWAEFQRSAVVIRLGLVDAQNLSGMSR